MSRLFRLSKIDLVSGPISVLGTPIPPAEFTPKTIQTKEERANLVYAMKIKVKNDGYLKLGMYGEVKFNAQLTTKN